MALGVGDHDQHSGFHPTDADVAVLVFSPGDDRVTL